MEMRPKAERLWDKEPKSILRSIKPYWVYLILTGKKTVELSKTVPKSEVWNGIVEIYCSKDLKSFQRIPEEDRGWMSRYLGKVAGRFMCPERILALVYPEIFAGHPLFYSKALEAACVTQDEAEAYSKGRNVYGWRINEVQRYEEPREISEYSKKHWERILPMKRPPESWCYVRSGGI
jgi:predicted transcriptional regulator